MGNYRNGTTNESFARLPPMQIDVYALKIWPLNSQRPSMMKYVWQKNRPVRGLIRSDRKAFTQSG